MLPERWREFGLNEQGSSTSCNLTIGTLSYAILMRLVWLSVLTSDSFISTELIEFLANEFPSFVISGAQQWFPSLFLSRCLVLLEGLECFTLLFQECSHLPSRLVV